MKRKINPSPQYLERPYICGIGGIGMSGVAHLLCDKGIVPSGSDLRQSELTAQLQSRGIQIVYETRPDIARSASSIIAPMSFPDTHAEIRAAINCGIPVLRRAAAIAQICSDANCVLCFGTASRGKLPWLFYKSHDCGRCAGSAACTESPELHAKFGQQMFVDIDEREFLCDPDSFDAFFGSDIIVSDWQNDELGYYRQEPFAHRYTIDPDDFSLEARKRILDDEAIMILPESTKCDARTLLFSAFSNTQKCDEAVFHLSDGMMHAPETWGLAPMQTFGTISDASALAAALFWRHCRDFHAQPQDIECTGWFRKIAPRQYHDIRMHPVNLKNAIATLKAIAGKNPISVAIKPFGQTLKSYTFEQWQTAFSGIDRLLVIVPPYEGCSEESAISFSDAMRCTGAEILIVTAAQAHENILDNEFRLWSGAGDIL